MTISYAPLAGLLVSTIGFVATQWMPYGPRLFIALCCFVAVTGGWFLSPLPETNGGLMGGGNE